MTAALYFLLLSAIYFAPHLSRDRSNTFGLIAVLASVVFFIRDLL